MILLDTQSIKNVKKFTLLSLIILSIFVSSNPVVPVSADVPFNDAINISNDPTIASFEFQLATAGSNVYVVWRNNTSTSSEILLKASTNNGGSFGTAIRLSNTASGLTDSPQLNASGTSVYVVWKEDDASPSSSEIYFSNSTDSGASFFPRELLSVGDSSAATQPQIAISGTNVYAIWREGSTPEINFRNSTDSGVTFDSDTGGIPFNLSSDAGLSKEPQIVASGNNVYVAWYNDTSSSLVQDTIAFRASTNNAASFGSKISLGNIGTGTLTPNLQMAASASKVYVVWQQSNEIFFANSTNSGTSFDPDGPFNLSNTGDASTIPQIAVSGSNVYVVWQESVSGNNEIYLRISTNSGASFGSAINLSSNSGSSTKPQLVSTGNNVYVIWQDATPGTNDVLFRSSPDSGATFCSQSNLASDDGSSTNPLLALAGSSVYAAWLNRTGTLDDVRFRAGTATATCVVQFGATQYKLSQTATFTVTDPASNNNAGVADTISVRVTSNSDSATGITLTLTESDVNTGSFPGSLTFTTGSSSGSTLKAAPGDTITANNTSGGQLGTASIFPRTVAFNFPGGYDRGAIAQLTITDQNSNTDIATNQTVTVSVVSTTDSTGTTLILSETDENTGIFGGSNSSLIFMTGNDLFTIGSTITITQDHAADNTNDATIQTITAAVTSSSDSTGIPALSLTETGVATGIFEGTLTFTSGATDAAARALHAEGGDIISVTHDGLTSRGLMTPNTNAARGAIQVSVGNTLTATYLGSTGTSSIILGGGEGGGGGGLVRPGLVLNVLAATLSAVGGGGGADSSPPSFTLGGTQGTTSSETTFGGAFDPFKPISPSTEPSGVYPLKINGLGYPIAGYTNTLQPYTVEVDQDIELELVFYESSSLQHVALNFATGEQFSDKDPTITFDKGQLQVFDPNDLLSDDVKVTTSKDGTKYVLHYDIKLKKIGEFNLMIRAWDDKRNAADTKIFDAFKVIDVTREIPPSETVQTETGLPGIVAAEKVEPVLQREDLDKFMPFIEQWGGYSSESISDSEMLEQIGIEAEYVPSWFKDTTRWVVRGDISPEEFVYAIKYLYEEGIIK